MLKVFLEYNANNANFMLTLRTAKSNNFTHVIYPELSYKINGVLYEVRQELGPYCNEKQYCDLIECKLKKHNLGYEREKILPPSFDEEAKRNKIDFLVEDKIILEIKTKRFSAREDYYQIRRYLKALDKKLGIIVNFRQKYIQPKRILNSSAKE